MSARPQNADRKLPAIGVRAGFDPPEANTGPAAAEAIREQATPAQVHQAQRFDLAAPRIKDAARKLDMAAGKLYKAARRASLAAMEFDDAYNEATRVGVPASVLAVARERAGVAREPLSRG